MTLVPLTRAIATFGYVGFVPVAAGTAGSLAALLTGYLLHRAGGFPLLAAAALAAYCLGYWATHVETHAMDDLDPRHIVIDEVVGMWVALMPLSFGLWHAGAPPALFPWPGWVAGFLLFRLFDIWKPWPVRWADRRKGPTGVMLGDVLAGTMAAALVALMAAIAHGVARMIAEARARALIEAARARGWRIAAAESCTGGLVAAALTDIAGSSDVFDRGFVCYSYPSKVAMLGVPQMLLTEHGAVSEPVARAMAEGALAASDAEVAVAITGVAGPGALEAKPEGLVWFATATAAGTRAERRDFGPLGRHAVRLRSVETALELALQALARAP